MLELIALTPADGATGVAINAEVSATFDQNITSDDLTGITINGAAATASISNNQLIINHANFAYNTTYTVFIPANTIIGYIQDTTWSFKTFCPEYTITSSAGANGAIEPLGVTTVNYGTNKTYTITPNTGYVIAQVLVDGVNQPAAVTSGEYTFENITGSHTISATFTAIPYTLTFDPAGGSVVTPTSVTVYYGVAVGSMPTNPTRTGYTFAGWFIDDTQISATYLWNYTANQTAEAHWTANTYTLSFDPDGGTVLPAFMTVTYGQAIGASIPVPTRAGHSFTGWKIDGTPVDDATVWEYTTNQWAIASWVIATHTLTVVATPGTVGVSGPGTVDIPVTFGVPIGPALINATPPTGCSFAGWFIGSTQIVQSTLWNYATNQTAHAAYTYGITVQASGPGTYTPMGALPYPNTIYYALNEIPTPYIFTPNADSYIASVVIDGVPEFIGDNEVYATFTYPFDPVTEPHNVQVTFAKRFYEMNPGNIIGAGVTVSMNPTPVQHGQTVTFTFTAECYEITSVKIDGVLQLPIPTSYTMVANGPLPLIEIESVEAHYTITATPAQDVDPMGYISPSGVYEPTCDEVVTYTFHPESGYRVKTLLVDGIAVPIPASNTYSFTNLTKDRTIELVFEESPKYVISFGPDSTQKHGGIVYSDQYPEEKYYLLVDSATAELSFTITPDEGYVIDKVYVDYTVNNSATTTGTYTFKNIIADHSIYATFKPIMFTITATTGAHGSILPSGSVKVAYGEDQTFNAVPDNGYQIDKILVDGSENAAAVANGFYAFENVKEDHTITATFAKKSYVITTIAGSNGTISPVNPSVLHGSNQTIYFQPNTGYAVDQVLVDGVVVGTSIASYTFVNVTVEHTIEVIFAKAKFTITATHQSGGENSFITPSGVATVDYNTHSEIYVFVSDAGYYVKNVLIDGVNSPLAVEAGMYRFMNVKENHTIHVIFAKDNYTIMATASQGGTITPSGTIAVPNGAAKTFYFQPGLGYKLARVLINGINNESALALGSYTFENVSQDHTIEAQFAKKQYDVIYEEVLGAVIEPIDGSVSPVDYGGKYKFRVKIQEGYTQSNIIVRANNMIINPSGDHYLINNISADQHITINGVALNQYKITAKAYYGGTITPTGTFMIEHGKSMPFDMLPNPNYVVSDVLVNGSSVGAVTTYLFNDVRADGKIEVYFKNNVGIEVNDEASIQVFSHQNIVTIINESQIPVKQVEIMDMYGRLIWVGPVLDVKTNITLNVAKGVYAVRIITEEKQNLTTKVVIH